MLALLPTATANVLAALNTEDITYEIQQAKASKASKASKATGAGAAAPPSIADTTLTEDDGKSMGSLQSDSGLHASQIAVPSPLSASTENAAQDAGAEARQRRSKRQLWDDLIISCKLQAILR